MISIDSLYQAVEIESLKRGELRPLVFRGEVVKEYYMDSKGNVWSAKWNKLRKLAVSFSGRYPDVKFQHKGKAMTVDIHRLVAETYHPKPMPYGITLEQFESSPRNIQLVIADYMSHLQVNHIDHDTTNYHPNNLEWISGRENNQKAYDHYYG